MTRRLQGSIISAILNGYGGQAPETVQLKILALTSGTNAPKRTE